MKTLKQLANSIFIHNVSYGNTEKVHCPCGNIHIFRRGNFLYVECTCGRRNKIGQQANQNTH